MKKGKNKKTLAIIGATTISSIALAGCNSDFKASDMGIVLMYGPVPEPQREFVDDGELDNDIDFNPALEEVTTMYGPAPNSKF